MDETKNEIESYKLGQVQVTVSETGQENKLNIHCFNGEFKSEFTVSRYEYENYKRLMNQRISRAFSGQTDDE